MTAPIPTARIEGPEEIARLAIAAEHPTFDRVIEVRITDLKYVLSALATERARREAAERERALERSQEQKNAENLVAIREAIIIREIRMRTEQLRFDAANPDFGDRYQREVAAALADQFDEFADDMEAPAAARVLTKES